MRRLALVAASRRRSLAPAARGRAEPGRPRGRARLPDLQDDPRPVGRARRAADEADHPRRGSPRARPSSRSRPSSSPSSAPACSPSRRSRGFDLLAWLVPLGVLGAGGVGVGALAWGWSRRRGDTTRAAAARTRARAATRRRARPVRRMSARRDPGRVARGARLVPGPVRPAARARLPVGRVGGGGGGARAARDGAAGRRLEHPVRPRVHAPCSSRSASAPRCSAAPVPRPVPARAGRRASCSSCSGSRSWASCPGPSGSSGRDSSRAPAPAAHACCSAARSRSVPRRASGRCSRRSSSSPGRRRPCSRARRSSRVYSLGLAIPFVLAGAVFTRAMGAFRWLRDHYRAIQFAGGLVMVALGLLLFFGKFYVLRIYVNRALEWFGSSPCSRSGPAAGRAGPRSPAPRQPRPGRGRERRRRRGAAGAYGPRRRVAFASWRDAPGWFPFAAWCQATVTWTSPWRKSRSAAGASRHSSSSASCASNQRSARISSIPCLETHCPSW